MPDEYSDIAWNNRGRYTCDGIAAVWERRLHDEPTLNQEYKVAAISDEDLDTMGRNHGVAYGKAFFAMICSSPSLERELCKAGEAESLNWIRANLARIPRLAIRKFRAEYEPWIGILGPHVILALTVLTSSSLRRWAIAVLAVFVGGILCVMATHAVGGRFIVSYLPALYILSSVGAARLLVSVDRFDQRLAENIRLPLR
jgi:hypothetical protein